ncbi:MAG: DUF3160 domain-containing protein [Calditrichaeota bacterium]|nr:DUF3160 domain-containing protein [Calditrichota bacterium]
MKRPVIEVATNSKLALLISIIMLFWMGCSDDPQQNRTNGDVAEQTAEKAVDEQNQTLQVMVSDNKESLRKYYEIPHIKEFYDWQEMHYTPPPALSYPEDLSVLSYGELRLLRNEMFARNGYLFQDGFLRGYFNRFKWYMPIFDVDSFRVVLTPAEAALVNQLRQEEEKRKKNALMDVNGLKLYNAALVVNEKQFTAIPREIENDLRQQNFSIVTANRALPFYIYDENAYQYIPHYITTDLYLFILHKYFSRFLEKLDEETLSPALQDLLGMLSEKTDVVRQTGADLQLLSALEWARTYLAIARQAAGDTLATVPERYQAVFEREIASIAAARGTPVFIENPFVNYEELTPRGHYSKSARLQHYFKAFKWISQNGIDLNDDAQLRGMLVLAYVIKNDPAILRRYQRYVETVEKLAGQEDNPSLRDLIAALEDQSITETLLDENLRSVRGKLQNLNKERIKRVFGASFQTKERDIQRIYFLSSTYSISGEIFSRLVQIDAQNSKRSFPRGLDLPAVFGNRTAQDILTGQYQEGTGWPEYLPRLTALQQQFANFSEWDHNYGFKGLQTALAASAEAENYPDFMKTTTYNRRELSTALASWTHLKHDLLLYQEKPFAAEMGQGGGPGPPQPCSYVEPNLIFWDTALELIDWLEKLAPETYFADELARITSLGRLLRKVAQKELAAQEVTAEEYRQLHYVGGTIEYILLGLLETDHLPARERSMALIADVYVYNNTHLNVAVGHADDIYVVVPIAGEYHIARGAVFSYYEFKGQLYNDDQWKALIEAENQPARPEWLKNLVQQVSPLKGQMQFRYEGSEYY